MRSHQWGGYYRRDSVDRPDILFGIQWLNAFDCGTYTDADGVRQGVSFAIFFSAEFPDCQGRFAESFDISLDDADYYCQHPIFQAAATGQQLDPSALDSLDWLPASVRALVAADLAEGLDAMQIFERRAGVLTYRFLGFTFDEMLAAHPDIWQPITDPESGQVVGNLRRCSLEDSDADS